MWCVRAPRYALLTGLAFVFTLLFNMSYANADIRRYYLGPTLWVWTWLGILAVELAVAAGRLGAALVERLQRIRVGERAPGRATAGAANAAARNAHTTSARPVVRCMKAPLYVDVAPPSPKARVESM